MGSKSSRLQYDYDLVVVGAGSAGLTAAAFAADVGARVLLIERRPVLGGDCTWNGCVPSKALIAAAHAASARRGARAKAFFGGEASSSSSSEEASSSSSPPKDSQRREVEEGARSIAGAAVGAYVRKARETVYAQETPEVLAEEHGVETRFGEATFESAHSVRVGDSEAVTFWKVVLNTGSRPVVPAELRDVPYDTNETIFDNPPASGTRLAVVGGGPIGAELAQACARLGASVVVFAGRGGLVPRERPDAREVVLRAFADDGVEVVTPPPSKGTKTQARSAVAKASVDESEIVLELTDGSRRRFDRLLIATGRQCVVPSSATSALGVQVDDQKSGGFLVDRKTLLCKGAKHAYAAGDCVANGPQFTHVAGFQGYVAARNALLPGNDDASATLDVRRVPRVTYTDPEVGSVGLADVETAARVLGVAQASIEVVKWTSEKNDRAVCEADDPAAFVELVLRVAKNGKTARVVGGTAVGLRAGELLSEIAVIAHHQLTTLQVAKVVHPYPTYNFVIQVLCSKDATRRFLRNSFLGRRITATFANRPPVAGGGAADKKKGQEDAATKKKIASSS